MTAGRVLYISTDPVLEPLAYSQVIRLVVALATRGVRYSLLSVERERDLKRQEHVARVERVLGEARVPWERIVGGDATGSARRSLSALSRALAAAARGAVLRRYELIHARSYQAAALARTVRGLAGVPYIFDARGYWIDERSSPGDWFAKALPYAAGKLLERELVHRAAGIVTLTSLHAADLRASLGDSPVPIEAIPTCADYGAFPVRTDEGPRANPAVPDSIKQTLAGRLVVGLVGSINRFYLTEASVRLAKLVLDASERAHLLVLSANLEGYRALLRAAEVPLERVTLAFAPHDDMPGWLSLLDWGLLLLEDTAAKRGSMPTKLAEFFASGVRPVAFGCNSEFTGWVRRAGSGLVLDSVDEASLRRAAQTIATSPTDFDALRTARAVTEPHFGLNSGVARYDQLLRKALTSRPS